MQLEKVLDVTLISFLMWFLNVPELDKVDRCQSLYRKSQVTSALGLDPIFNVVVCRTVKLRRPGRV